MKQTRTFLSMLVLFVALAVLPGETLAQSSPITVGGGGGALQSSAAPSDSPITVGGGGGALVAGDSPITVGGGEGLSLLVELAISLIL
jgi:hypothetical protein